MKIIFLSHTPRSSLFKVGSTHLSREFAQMGHQVLYVPSAISPFHLLNIAGLKSADYRKSLKSRLGSYRPRRDRDGVINLTPLILTPFAQKPFDSARIPLRQWFTFNRMGNQLKTLGFDQPDLVIQDKPGLFFMRKFINARTWIYRPTDNYSVMTGGLGKDAMRKLESAICEFSDQVVVTSAPLQKFFKQCYGKDAAILRNGVDITHFTKLQKIPAEYENFKGPVILYVGSLDSRFNRSLLLQTAQKNSDYRYVIIGPGSKKAFVKGATNITGLGPRPYEQIPGYMQYADVGILPLKMTPANHARSPMKMYEYGACGLPIVSTPLQELKMRGEDFVTFAETDESFCARISYCLAHQRQLSKLARESSKVHSWKKIAKRLLELIASKVKQYHDR